MNFLLLLFLFLTNLIQFDGDDIYVTPLNNVEFHKNSCIGGRSS